MIGPAHPSAEQKHTNKRDEHQPWEAVRDYDSTNKLFFQMKTDRFHSPSSNIQWQETINKKCLGEQCRVLGHCLI